MTAQWLFICFITDNKISTCHVLPTLRYAGFWYCSCPCSMLRRLIAYDWEYTSYKSIICLPADVWVRCWLVKVIYWCPIHIIFSSLAIEEMTLVFLVHMLFNFDNFGNIGLTLVTSVPTFHQHSFTYQY